MLDVFDIAEILVEDIRKRFAASIAIVAYYGSYANGTATPRSDLDFFFIPDGTGAFAASRQFIIGGIGFDFWPITWERAERIASFDEAIVSVIADSRVFYSRSEADLGRFDALKQKIEGASLPESRPLMIRKAANQFKDCYAHLFEAARAARRGDLSGTRRSAATLASAAARSLATLNQTYFKKGMGQNAVEIAALRLKPEGLDDLLGTVSTSSDCAVIHGACETLVAGTANLLAAEEAGARKPASLADALTGFHEEALSTYNKIITACERGDRETAFYASINLQREVESALEACEGSGAYRRLGLPDLAADFEPEDLRAFEGTIRGMETQFREVLKSKGVPLSEYASVEEFRGAIGRN